MIEFMYNKVSANEAAKRIMEEAIAQAVDYYTEECLLNIEKATDKEKEKLKEAVNKQAERLIKKLNFKK